MVSAVDNILFFVIKMHKNLNMFLTTVLFSSVFLFIFYRVLVMLFFCLVKIYNLTKSFYTLCLYNAEFLMYIFTLNWNKGNQHNNATISVQHAQMGFLIHVITHE